jgi:hypothetical protein
MSIMPLYEFDEEQQREIIKLHLSMPRGGEVTGPTEGSCGFDLHHQIATLTARTPDRGEVPKCCALLVFWGGGGAGVPRKQTIDFKDACKPTYRR